MLSETWQKNWIFIERATKTLYSDKGLCLICSIWCGSRRRRGWFKVREKRIETREMWTKTNLEPLEKLCTKFDKIASELTTLAPSLVCSIYTVGWGVSSKIRRVQFYLGIFIYLQTKTRCILSYLIILGDFVVKLLIEILSSFYLRNVIDV